MIEEAALARLLARSDGASADIALLRATIEEASEIGARRALGRLGLDDAAARDDIVDLRELLEAWRDAKRSARNAAVEWIVRGFLVALLIALAVKLGLLGLLR